MRAFCSRRHLRASSDARVLKATGIIARPPFLNTRSPCWRSTLPECVGALSLRRGAKTKASLKVNELPQGVLGLDPLPELEADDAPQYPTVVQGARNNMTKFKDCVVLTRVGSFYEVLRLRVPKSA